MMAPAPDATGEAARVVAVKTLQARMRPSLRGAIADAYVDARDWGASTGAADAITRRFCALLREFDGWTSAMIADQFGGADALKRLEPPIEAAIVGATLALDGGRNKRDDNGADAGVIDVDVPSARRFAHACLMRLARELFDRVAGATPMAPRALLADERRMTELVDDAVEATALTFVGSVHRRRASRRHHRDGDGGRRRRAPPGRHRHRRRHGSSSDDDKHDRHHRHRHHRHHQEAHADPYDEGGGAADDRHQQHHDRRRHRHHDDEDRRDDSRHHRHRRRSSPLLGLPLPPQLPPAVATVLLPPLVQPVASAAPASLTRGALAKHVQEQTAPNDDARDGAVADMDPYSTSTVASSRLHLTLDRHRSAPPMPLPPQQPASSQPVAAAEVPISAAPMVAAAPPQPSGATHRTVVGAALDASSAKAAVALSPQRALRLPPPPDRLLLDDVEPPTSAGNLPLPPLMVIDDGAGDADEARA